MSTPQPVTHVSAMTDLRSYTGASDGEAIILDAYHPDSMVGGGVFAWDASSTVADDGGITIRPNSVATGRWVRRFFGEAITPEMFGALGDGVADDAQEVQKAINAAKSISWLNMRGTGTYAISNTVSIAGATSGSRFYLNRVIVLDTFPDPATWLTAKPAFEADGAIVNIDLEIGYIDGANKACAFAFDKGTGWGASHLHIGQAERCVGVYRGNKPHWPSANNYVTGERWTGNVYNVYLEKKSGGWGDGSTNPVVEGHVFEIMYPTSTRYGSFILRSGAQYTQIRGLPDWGGRNLSELTVNTYSGISNGDTVTNGTVTCEVMARYTYNGTARLLVMEDHDVSVQGTDASSFADGDSLTSADVASFSATVISSRTGRPNGGWFDIIHDFQDSPLAKCTIYTAYLGGIVGGKLNTSVYVAMNSGSSPYGQYTFGMRVVPNANSGFAIYNSAGAGAGALMDVTDDLTAIQNNLRVSTPNRIYGTEVGSTLALNTAKSIRTFARHGNPAIPGIGDIYRVTYSGNLAGPEYGEFLLRVSANAVGVTMIAQNTGNIVFSNNGLTLVATQSLYPSGLTLLFNFQRIL